MDQVRLEQVIRQYVQVPLTPSGGGWFPVLHTTCDKGHKGPRAGFRFDGDSVAFHCFNCSMATGYDPDKHRSMPRKMVQIMEDFNIPEDEWRKVEFTSLARQNSSELKITPEKKVSIEPLELDLPKTFYKLKDAANDDPWKEIAEWYLSERGLSPDSADYMLSADTDIEHLKKWKGRLIIPVYKQNKLIFYQGRDMTGKKQKKYESPAVSRDKVLYNFDKLFAHDDKPIIVVEGIFDALMVDGVAIFGNELSKAQIEWLNRSRKTKIYVPDQFGDGDKSASQAIDQGWSISTPEIGNCKDLNEAVLKYGKLYVMKSIADNTSTGFEAKMRMKMYCK